LLNSNHNSFRVLFDKIASAYFAWKIYLYLSIGNGQPREPALCQLYRHTFVRYSVELCMRFAAAQRDVREVINYADRSINQEQQQLNNIYSLYTHTYNAITWRTRNKNSARWLRGIAGPSLLGRVKGQGSWPWRWHCVCKHFEVSRSSVSTGRAASVLTAWAMVSHQTFVICWLDLRAHAAFEIIYIRIELTMHETQNFNFCHFFLNVNSRSKLIGRSSGICSC